MIQHTPPFRDPAHLGGLAQAHARLREGRLFLVHFLEGSPLRNQAKPLKIWSARHASYPRYLSRYHHYLLYVLAATILFVPYSFLLQHLRHLQSYLQLSRATIVLIANKLVRLPDSLQY